MEMGRLVSLAIDWRSHWRKTLSDKDYVYSTVEIWLWHAWRSQWILDALIRESLRAFRGTNGLLLSHGVASVP